MTYKEEMLRHLQRAEACNTDVDTFEDWASKQVERTHRASLDRARSKGNRESIKHQAMTKVLETEPLYKQRANVRDFHVRMATMYGIAHLVRSLDRE